ncbi:MAG: hypothetical protein ACLFWM_04235 [Actinomycetota bacterium]
MQVTSASFAYPSVGESQRADLARVLADAPVPEGVFVLSTCLRVEVTVPGDDTVLKETLDQLLGDVRVQPTVREGQEAVEHLFRLAAGLESPIMGEVEVLTQFRRAVTDMRETGSAEGWFLKLLESAISTGRDARDLMPASAHDTMAAVAAQLVGPAERVAVVGSGTMARSVVEALAGLPAPPRVTVLAREPDRVVLEGADVLALDEVPSVLSRFPVVVSATAASKRLMDRGEMEAVLRRRTASLLLVDMAMPPDFAPAAADSVHYVGIDELASLASRRPRTGAAEEHVADAARETYHLLATRGRAGPVIASLLAEADRVVDETVERFAGRLSEEADRDVLRQTAHTVARTILNRPVSALRSTRDPDLIEAMSSVFDHE